MITCKFCIRHYLKKFYKYKTTFIIFFFEFSFLSML